MMNRISAGTDIIEVGRIRKSCASRRFCERVFSRQEREMFALSEVSCLRDDRGCPYLEFSGEALRIVEQKGVQASVSISHTKEYATAVVILFGE